LRIAVYVQATQIARYAGIEESRERAIIQVDTIPAIAGDCRKQKHCCRAGEEFHTITAVPTNSAALDSQRGGAGLNAASVVENAGIGSFEVRDKYSYAFSRIALEDVITAEHPRSSVSD